MRYVEEACGEWDQFLDAYAGVSRARGGEHVATLRAGLRPYRELTAVRSLGGKVREVARLKAA